MNIKNLILGVLVLMLVFQKPMNVQAQNGSDKNAQPKAIAKKKIDPICDMPAEKSWKEFTVYQNDTVRFCSDVCRKIFLKKPEKYAAKLK